MDKTARKIFSIIFPFYPLWLAVIYILTNKNIGNYMNLLWLPLVFTYLIYKQNRFPKYLIYLIAFTIFHLLSVYLNDIMREDTNWFFFLLADNHLQTCAIFFLVENTTFDLGFVNRMNRNIFIILMISLAVSLIQIKFPLFFINPESLLNEDLIVYFDEGRIDSIFSWAGANSLGISIPIMVSILLSYYVTRKSSSVLVILSGIIISFLNKSRYIMISVVIAMSQLLFNAKIVFQKKMRFLIILMSCVLVSIGIAGKLNYDINQVINERIFEKGNDMRSANARILSYQVFLLKFPEHPWFGVGPETRDDVINLLGGEAPLIHVGYLSYLYWYGIIGSGLLFAGLFLLLKSAWQIGKENNYWGSFYGLISFCFANLTFVYFNFNEMGIVLAVLYLRYYKQKEFIESIEERNISTLSYP